MPLAASVAITGRTISSMTARSSAGVTSGDGEYAPMPPVLGPVSPSPRRLWSCDDASGTTVSPSVTAMNDTSSPARNSSITTRRPASPNAPRRMLVSIAACASARVAHTATPFPAARPSALTTTGAPTSST